MGKNHKDIVVVESKEYVFKALLLFSGGLAVFILVVLFSTLCLKSALSFNKLGFSFFIDSTWDPVKGHFGALPFFLGTIITSIISLLIAIPFSIALAIFLGECMKKGPLPTLLSSTIDLLAGIPSVIYGFWGMMVLVPIIRNIQNAIGVTPNGVGILTSSIILAIMIIPYSASISKEVLSLVPTDIKEAALSLGATQTEVIKKIMLPYVRSGIFAGLLMSFGRAISETMAVTMLIGNSNKIPNSIFSPANTLASVIANEFAEASEALYLSSLIELALILFFITALFSFIGRLIIKKWVVPC